MTTTFTAAELRKWADDMEQFFGSSSRVEVLAKAEAHADRMRARADLIDAENDEETGVADVAEIVQVLPIIGEVRIRGGKRVAIERPYNGEGERHGIYTAWEFRDDPAAEEEAGSLCRLYVGTVQDGPLAQYNAYDGQWYELKSRGNFGRRYACGGNWSGKKVAKQPEIINKLEEIMDRQEAIKKAELRLAAASKRVHAAHQMANAAAHDRQATNPIYEGQSMICMVKADTIRAYAARTLAEADLLDAQACVVR